MLKFVFWALVAANTGLFAYSQGYLGQAGAGEREPARLANQLAPERLVPMTAADAQRAVDGAAPAAASAPAEESTLTSSATSPATAPTPTPDTAPPAAPVPAPAAPAPPPARLVACVQAGPFSAIGARRFEARAARLGLAARQTRIEVPFQEVTSHLVYLPASGGVEGAQKRVADLKERGIDNFFIMQGDSPLRGAISLGVFKTDGAAQKLAADLQRQGVRGVRILPRGPQGTRPAYQYRAIEPALRTQLADLADNYTGASLGNCD